MGDPESVRFPEVTKSKLQTRTFWAFLKCSENDIDLTVGLHRCLVDFTCRNDVSRSQLGKERVIEDAELRKHNLYRNMAAGLRAEFSVFTVRAFGWLCSSAQGFLDKLRRHGFPRDNVSSSLQIIQDLTKRISVAVHRYNGDAYIRGASNSQGAVPGAADDRHDVIFDF